MSPTQFVREREAWAAGIAPVAGVDEAGRGPLAGPVVAAAVVFSAECAIRHLGDSKQLSPRQREEVFAALAASGAAVGIGLAEVWEIDRFNIVGATRLAWSRAVAALPDPPALVLLDGPLQAPLPMPQLTVVRGDALCASIAAASVAAKVTRDRLMLDLDRLYPAYGFASHKGYATPRHLEALRRHGPSPVHRRGFLPAFLGQESLLRG